LSVPLPPKERSIGRKHVPGQWSFPWHEGCSNARERVPITWNRTIEKDSLKIEEMEHVLSGKPLRNFLRTCAMALQPFEACAHDEEDMPR